jgi:putative ABC transport system ATP-binding protein
MPGEIERTSSPILEVEGLSKGYREAGRFHAVLERVNARVEQGEFVALLGPSGSGKSTLLNLISGIDSPDHGSVRIGGVELTALDERERTVFRRRRIGFVFQFFNLLPTLTVRENLLLPLELAGGLDAAGERRARELLDAVGLGSRGDAFPDRLSGGEQQRVAIARALVHDPALLLADEPTGNLDERTGGRVMELLDSMVRGAGKTLLVVTHSREVASRADRILELHNGKLTSGSPVATKPRDVEGHAG